VLFLHGLIFLLFLQFCCLTLCMMCSLFFKHFSSWNNKQKLFSIFRYGNVVVSGRQSTIQSTPKREPSVEISQSRKYAHRCMFCCHSYRSHEETNISYNKNKEIRVNKNGQIVPSAR
jgi:hypothetical protein